jgi:MarR family transcriptional regulator, 2-MHQ and catechol-resistance regulon repressor
MASTPPVKRKTKQRPAAVRKEPLDLGSREALRSGIEKNSEQFAMDPESSALAIDLMLTLRRTSTAIERLLQYYMRKYQLSPAKVTILMALAGTDGHTLAQADISRRASVSLGNLTALTESLEQARLIRRRRNPDDGRVTLISLTPAGTSLVKRFAPVHFRIVEKACSSLTRRDQLSLFELLNRLRQAVKSEDLMVFCREQVAQ